MQREEDIRKKKREIEEIELEANRINKERLQKQELFLLEKEKELDEARRKQDEWVRLEVQKEVGHKVKKS